MSNNYYTQQSTNFQSNPFSKAKIHSKQCFIYENQNKFQQDNSNTLNFNDIQLPCKIVIPTDQQITIKTVINKNTIKTNNTQNNFRLKQDQNHQACASKTNIPVNIPANKKVESILNKEPLRQKYIELLPEAYKKSIGHQHAQLIKIMGFIDNSIQFIAQNRSLKFIFFQDLKRQIKDSLRIVISLGHIQQILFLDEHTYQVKWQYNQNKRAYDLQIILTKIQSKDQRKQGIRKKIIQFLLEKQQDQLEVPNNSQSFLAWSKGFDPQKYQIPYKSLPIHPQTKNAEIRGLDSNYIGKIQNENLKQLMAKKKQQSQVGSLKSNDVLQKIFNKQKNSVDISAKILEAVKQKQRFFLEQRKNNCAQNQEVLNKVIMKELCQQTMLIYISKGVGNMFRVGLIQLLNGRTKYSTNIIQKNLDYIISIRDVSYLKQIITSNKSVVIQINKSKLKEILQKIQSIDCFQSKK